MGFGVQFILYADAITELLQAASECLMSARVWYMNTLKFSFLWNGWGNPVISGVSKVISNKVEILNF